MIDQLVNDFVKYARQQNVADEDIANYLSTELGIGNEKSAEEKQASAVDSFYSDFFNSIGVEKTDESMIYADSFIKSAMANGLDEQTAIQVTAQWMVEKTAQEHPYVDMLRQARPALQKEAIDWSSPGVLAALGGLGGAGVGALTAPKETKGKKREGMDNPLLRALAFGAGGAGLGAGAGMLMGGESPEMKAGHGDPNEELQRAGLASIMKDDNATAGSSLLSKTMGGTYDPDVNGVGTEGPGLLAGMAARLGIDVPTLVAAAQSMSQGQTVNPQIAAAIRKG